ncbi:hypothetical protein PVK06_005505 [Gossypium arboreum]|uniref:CCHC-type domain-containing protein n=1 Tax=Gossypium arboreum TaxID=29729 RepID=A0ABR0QV79_GOSAR|nr:hypothetical protein PVK06_005505 [Gossypium arboreum]
MARCCVFLVLLFMKFWFVIFGFLVKKVGMGIVSKEEEARTFWDRACQLSNDVRIHKLSSQPILPHIPRVCKWEKPLEDFFKINVDATVNNFGTGLGIIIRDSDGFVIKGRGLMRLLYNRKILEEISDFIGRLVKLNYNTNSRSRGRFAQMAVYVNLDKPLIPQILVNGTVQRVQYEALPLICFGCGRYGHIKALCPHFVDNLDHPMEKGGGVGW